MDVVVVLVVQYKIDVCLFEKAVRIKESWFPVAKYALRLFTYMARHRRHNICRLLLQL